MPESDTRAELRAPIVERRFLQNASVGVATIVIAALHWPNDGLWFQGDAPRHAANGLFVWDYLTSLPADPLQFALSYYARYPVIAPLIYPPLFYAIEAVAFGLIAPSPLLAKTLVLLFAAMTGLYVVAWARRWGGAAAGWAGACVVLLPGFVRYSNTVMLNVPATALTIAALYHLIVWLETGDVRQRRRWVLFLAASVLTYYPAVFALPIMGLWLVWSGRWRWRAWWLLAVSATALVVLLVLAVSVPDYITRNAPSPIRLGNTLLWRFYGREILEMVGLPWAIAGTAGLLVGVVGRASRRQAGWLAAAVPTTVALLVMLPAESGRYGMWLTPMLVVGAFIGLGAIAGGDWRSAHAGMRRWWPTMAIVALGGIAIWSAAVTKVPRVAGFEAAAIFLRDRAPTDAVLYSGDYDGVFSFYVRVHDPRFERRVVLAHKLLARYAQARSFTWEETSHVQSAAEVVAMIQGDCSCRWVAVEVTLTDDRRQFDQHLRLALYGNEFDLVESFPITGSNVVRLDVYRFLPALKPLRPVDLVFPSFSQRVFRGVEPIQRRQ